MFFFRRRSGRSGKLRTARRLCYSVVCPVLIRPNRTTNPFDEYGIKLTTFGERLGLTRQQGYAVIEGH